MALIVTAGAANAQSYADADFALAYFATHLQREGWTAIVNVDTAEASLLAAMPMMEDQAYVGYRVTDNQALEFPRIAEYDPNAWTVSSSVAANSWTDARGRTWSSTAVPVPVQQAQCELALIIGSNPEWLEHRYSGKTVKAGNAEIKVKTEDDLTQLPHLVFRLLRPFLATTLSGGQMERA